MSLDLVKLNYFSICLSMDLLEFNHSSIGVAIQAAR
jgi:hypothetical protein